MAARLLLDEVSDMPLETQGKIVRALQDQTFERVGGNAFRVKVDVRVLAITNKGSAGRDRGRPVPRGPVLSPGGRAGEDAEPEATGGRTYRNWRKHFMTRAAESTRGMQAARPVRRRRWPRCRAYDWPGNVRQLRNLMDWLLIMAPGSATDAIRADMLPPEVGQGAPALLNFDPTADIMALPLREARDLFETQYLQAQLVRFGGNISRTAGFVGMERSALHRKLKQLGVNSDDKGG